MVKKYESKGLRDQESIKADVIVLGLTLPGIVAAHKLKKRFGNSMEIVVLDCTAPFRGGSRCSVTIQEQADEDEESDANNDPTEFTIYENVGLHYLSKYAREFNIPLPDSIIDPQKIRSDMNHLFQYKSGSAVTFRTDNYDFDYLSFIERFELNHYHNLLDQSMRNLFHHRKDSSEERKKLLYFDQTSMEIHLSQALICATSKDIMRATVSVVCGAPSEQVSVLFYLHQCFRTNGSRNHLDGYNTKFREKLLGFCRKRLSNKLQQSVADITLVAKPIREIRTYSDEQLILETMLGTNYICNLLAMALRPDQIRSIRFDEALLSDDIEAAKAMTPGRSKKFMIRYKENFWARGGYSGDILSIRGPIIWATERPITSTTGSTQKYAILIGYLKVEEETKDSKDAVIDQLVSLFGEEAASPVSYKETNFVDMYVPQCGDYVALRQLTEEEHPKFIVWGAFDIFADGDVAAALEAGHIAYLRLMNILRPQAPTYDDVVAAEHPTILERDPFEKYIATFSIMSAVKVAVVGCSLIAGIQLLRSMRK